MKIKIIVVPLATAIAASAALIMALPAHADDVTDMAFIAVLNKYSIPYSNEANAIAGAHAFCGLLNEGFTMTDAIRMAERNTGFTPAQTGYFIGAAVDAYCPQYKSELGIP